MDREQETRLIIIMNRLDILTKQARNTFRELEARTREISILIEEMQKEEKKNG